LWANANRRRDCSTVAARGKLPTASAVVADVIDALKNPQNNGRFFWENEKEGTLIDPKEQKNVFIRPRRAGPRKTLAHRRIRKGRLHSWQNRLRV
jgi:hypothetical protein